MSSDQPLRLAISQRVSVCDRYGERRDALAHDWMPLLERWGAIPLLVPNAWNGIEQFLKLWKVDAVLLTGGNSISQSQPPSSAGSAPERDETEWQLARCAVERRLPVLGVCRGAQMLNVAWGGTLTSTTNRAHAGCRHELLVDPDALDWAGFLHKRDVNSYHDELLLPTDLAPELRAFARAEDGSLEGIVHPQLPLLGVMWHPERESGDASRFDTLVRAVLGAQAPWLLAQNAPAEALL